MNDVIPDLCVDICGIKMESPVMLAAGTFRYDKRYPELDWSHVDNVGAIIIKSVTSKPREGNPVTRMVVTPSGVLNSIGIENSGVKTFIQEELPLYRRFTTNIIVSIAGETVDEYVEVARMICQCKEVHGIELNISCPNILKGGAEFGTDPEAAFDVVRKVKKNVDRLPIIAKLTPNVTDITEIALACQAGGADAISLINTLAATAIDIETFRPILGNTVGGLSGPAIRPVAVLRVMQVSQVFKASGRIIPIIGIGGITNARDALEFIIAGASAVQIGTAGLADRQIGTKVTQGIREWLFDHYQNTHDPRFLDIKNFIGCVSLLKREE